MNSRRIASERAVIGMCTAPTEVYTRTVGFFRPVQCMNKGKKEEYKDRVNFIVDKS